MTAPTTERRASVVMRATQARRVTDLQRRCAEPCTLVILGAQGDLTRRKLLPAIYQLAKEGLINPNFRVLGVMRDVGSDDSFRELMHGALLESDEIPAIDESVWSSLATKLHAVSGDLTDPSAYEGIKARLGELESKLPETDRNRLFYLAVPPSVFEPIVTLLSSSKLACKISETTARPWSRVVIEKPFGHDLASARELNSLVLSKFDECQVYRIDHYLGKETVQNILVFRFANSIFEPLWNRQNIAHVQITATEKVGVGSRGKYYEEAGVVRDMFQNHLLQLLTLTAMEPPVTMSADAVRDEKVKVLKSIRWLQPETIPTSTVRAQYRAGTIGEDTVRAFRAEPDVAPNSMTPTFAAIRLLVDNWRWKGVPFYLRSGKRMAKRVSEIAIQFREPPHLMFGAQRIEPNILVMRVQPNDGISLRFEVKVPGAANELTAEEEMSPVEMDFTYADAFGETVAPAYETLLLDVMLGDATLFTRSDEVEAAWKVTDPLLTYWAENPPASMPTYAAGSWGPSEADDLLARDGFRWRRP